MLSTSRGASVLVLCCFVVSMKFPVYQKNKNKNYEFNDLNFLRARYKIEQIIRGYFSLFEYI